MPLTDAELASALRISEAEAAKFIPSLSPERRAAYERLIEFSDEWNLFEAGVMPRPTGDALVDTDRSMKRRKIARAFLNEF